MSYAEKTTISANKTKADIEDLIQKTGANQFMSGYKDNVAVIGFILNKRQIQFTLPLPDKQDTKFWYTPERRSKRSEEQAYAAWEQACRAKWRALYLIIKAKLEAVESGISTIEKEFFYDIVLPNGQTVGAFMSPQVEVAYQTGELPKMIPMLG